MEGKSFYPYIERKSKRIIESMKLCIFSLEVPGAGHLVQAP